MREVRIHLAGCERTTQDQIRRRFERDGVVVSATDVMTDVVEDLRSPVPDVFLLDADHDPKMVMRCLDAVKRDFPELPVILFAADAEMPLVVESMRNGAFDFVDKPLDLTRLDIAIKNATQLHRLMQRVNQLQDKYTRSGSFQGLVGNSPPMRRLYDVIEHVSRTDVTVLVTGESGTGKELVAHAIHDLSDRRGGSFVAVNCASIPRDLLESELFGHEKGAFTGAVSRYIGSCEQADGGTLFLDELCEMDVSLQSKMLRFLQSRTFHRLGSTTEVKVDARIVAATNRDPLAEIKAGRLREDLYYRLNVVPIDAPPLRARKGDVPMLAETFLSRFSAKYGKYFYDFAPDALRALDAYAWPGNVRELENLIERIVVLNNGSQVTPAMLPRSVRTAQPYDGTDEFGRDPDVILPFKEVERREIIRALRICGGNVSKAAERLGIGQATMYRKIKKYGVRPRRKSRDTVRSGR